MVSADGQALLRLTLPSLTYGHSNGEVEGREKFVSSMVSGKYRFLAIRLSGQKVIMSGDVAVVRHQLDAETADAGKPQRSIRLHVVMVWQRSGSDWKLLARQAVKG